MKWIVVFIGGSFARAGISARAPLWIAGDMVGLEIKKFAREFQSGMRAVLVRAMDPPVAAQVRDVTKRDP